MVRSLVSSCNLSANQLDNACISAYNAGIMSKQLVQYTIRGVPPAVDSALRRRARRLRKSLNQTALEALAEGAGLEVEGQTHHDLDFLAGSWVSDPEVDKALDEQRQVEPELWQ